MPKRRLALVCLGVIAATVAFAFAAGSLRLFERGYMVSAVFADSGGIKRGDEIRLAGVPVGRVADVKPDFDHGQVIISFKVDHGIRLGRNTRADVQLATLLGGRYIKLSGPVSAPYLDSQKDRRIPAGRTSVPFTVTDAVSESTRIAERIDTKTVRKLLDQTNGLKYPDRQKIRRMLDNLGTLTATLNAHSGDFEQLVQDSEKLTTALSAKDTQLVQLLESSGLLLAELVKRRDDLSTALGQGADAVTALDKVIAAKQQKITALLDDLHLAGRTLHGGLGDLNTSLALLAPTFQGLARAGESGPWIDAGPVGAVLLNPGFIGGTP
ncbi:MlaD family protein [Actinocorallia longicatena]